MCYWIFFKHNYDNWYWLVKIGSFTYHFTGRNILTINTQVLLKGIRKWVTMTCRIISTNITIIPFHNDQTHVHHITINKCFINVFVIFFIYSIVKKIIIIPLLWQKMLLLLLLMILSTSPWGLSELWGGGVPTLEIHHSGPRIRCLLLRTLINPPRPPLFFSYVPSPPSSSSAPISQ